MLELPGEKRKFPLRWILLVVVTALLLGAVFYFSGREDEPEKETVRKEREILVSPEPEFLSLLPDDAYRLTQERQVVIVDVRTAAERSEAMIPGSISIPLTKVVAGEVDLPKEQPILLVCAVGGRSYGAGLYLRQQGYLQVYNLRGGISAWSKQGLPLEAGTVAGESSLLEANGAPEN